MFSRIPASLAAVVAVAGAVVLGGLRPTSAGGQELDRVLVRSLDQGTTGALSMDQGTAALWQRLRKLTGTASVLYTTGHPDDEEPGVLTMLGRGLGVRTALLTLNRGEGGANAVGPELFDGLGLIRTAELRLAGRYYGLDDQYFTTAADYGYSKTLDEALRSWDREALLADMVRIIRINRPLVVISRWHGSARDGHGHHQAAGVLTPLAVEAAADPGRFPEQLRDEGLRAWRVPKVYRSRIQTGEEWHVEIDPGAVDPVLGQSYQDVGSFGISLQRSQTAGRLRPSGGASPTRYERLFPAGPDTPEPSFFSGLDTSLPGVFGLVGEVAPPGASARLRAAEAAVREAMSSFDLDAPATIAGPLLRARDAIDGVLAVLPHESEAGFLLRVERAQVDHALAAALALRVEAVATRPSEGVGTPLGGVVPGQEIAVHVLVRGAAGAGFRVTEASLDFPGAAKPRSGQPASGAPARGAPASGTPLSGTPSSGTPPQGAEGRVTEAPPGEAFSRVLHTRIPVDLPVSRPWFSRGSIAENVYTVRDSASLGLGESPPALVAVVTVEVDGHELVTSVPVVVIESDAPFATLRTPLVVVPRFSVRASPGVKVLTPRRSGDPFEVEVEVSSHGPDAAEADVTLDLPSGWTSSPASAPLDFPASGGMRRFAFSVQPGGDPEAHSIVATVRSGGGVYREGFEEIRHRDLETQRLYRPAAVLAAPVNVQVAEGRRVGYVMGVGDQVPAAIRELGAQVALLDDAYLTQGDLSAYHVIVVGTRAYAVRPALEAANERLLAYMRGGGHLAVLYQTPEYAADRLAPFPATLPRSAEEVSEEDAPVRLLVPGHPLVATPNRLGAADFDGWIEQRGSKFFATWDDAYTALVETHDTGQAPQEGVWLTAPVGSGHFTYISLALHRQLPYGVPGAYRILGNLLSLGAEAR